ncbi:MAG: ATP-binding protein [Candidatus Omnitrophota bacterium]
MAITRTSIFIATYSLILGIPFALAFGYQERLISALGKNWWMVPLISSTVLATAGPFIYLFIQKRAEDRLLQEQRRYQMTLRQASSGMSKIKDLKKLLRMIVHIVTRTVHLEHSQVYLYDSTDKKFFLEATRNKGATKPSAVISIDSPLIRYLFGMREPIVYEEIKQRTQDYSDAELSQVEENLRQLDAAVVIPSFVENKLLAIIVLGKKLSGKLYSEDDLAVFSILANQAALAIENAQFYEDIKRTQEQLFQAEKMATIGTMADGLSHQINNRLHALGFIAGDALDTIRLKKEIKTPEEAQSILADLERSLTRIQDNVKQGGEVVQGLLKYTRKGEAGFSPVDFSQLLTASIEMAGYKVKLDQISIVKDFSEDIPKILGNFTQLQEVFFNLIDNAYDAMMQRKVEQKEPDYKGKINISARRLEGKIEIGVLDNGIGVKDEDSRKLFTPFFTTKLSSKKGTGLGLYVIQKIIEDNHGGKVSMSSEYMTGTLVTILLPTVN